jgi:hypothetical protein
VNLTGATTTDAAMLFSSIRLIFAFFATLARVHSAFQNFQHRTRLYRYSKFNGNFVLVALRAHAAFEAGGTKKLIEIVSESLIQAVNWVRL